MPDFFHHTLRLFFHESVEEHQRYPTFSRSNMALCAGLS